MSERKVAIGLAIGIFGGVQFVNALAKPSRDDDHDFRRQVRVLREDIRGLRDGLQSLKSIVNAIRSAVGYIRGAVAIICIIQF